MQELCTIGKKTFGVDFRYEKDGYDIITAPSHATGKQEGIIPKGCWFTWCWLKERQSGCCWEEIGRGLAVCSPDDHPDEATGKLLAFTRALNEAKLPWQVKDKLYSAYVKQGPLPRTSEFMRDRVKALNWDKRQLAEQLACAKGDLAQQQKANARLQADCATLQSRIVELEQQLNDIQKRMDMLAKLDKLQNAVVDQIISEKKAKLRQWEQVGDELIGVLCPAAAYVSFSNDRLYTALFELENKIRKLLKGDL